MQEETTQKTIALAIKTSKLTASVLQKAMKMYLEHQKHKQPSHGKIPVKKPCPVCLTAAGSIGRGFSVLLAGAVSDAPIPIGPGFLTK